MYHHLRRWALATITKTPLEPLARNVYGRLVPSKGNAYDQQTFELMQRCLRPDSNCIDVGAYRGEILQKMTLYSPKGHHYAFEPVPENYRYVASRFKNVTVHNMALGNQPGTVRFNHVVGRAARSGLQRVDYPDKHQKVEEIKVQLDSLDNVIPTNVVIDLIKIDVEGAELNVLRGARKLIARCRPIIIFEHELDKAEPYGTKPEQIYDLLAKELGMKIYLMQNYLAAEPALTRTEFIATVKNDSDFYFMATA